MSIHIGKNAIYNPNKVFRIESDNSNVLNLQSRTNKVNLNIQDFTLGQTSNIDKILNISTANTDLVSFKNDNITFYPEVFITSNVNITSNIIISNNITITGKINTITDVINISDDGNINTNNLFASNINIFTDIYKDVLVLGSNNENGFNTLFLISSSNNGEIYIKGNLGIGTEPSINDSIYVSSNVLVNANTYTSNIYTNKISNRDITSVSGISFTEDTLYLTADNSVIINKYSLGTELNLDTLTVNELLDTRNLNVISFININNDTNYPALLIKQGLTEEGLFVNSNTANPISVLSEFTNDRGNLSNIFQLSAKGHITLGGLYPDPENTNSEYMIRGDIRDDKLDYINGFINFTNCNIDKESFTITQDGHIGIGTQIPKGFLDIKNNYTEINDNYTKPDSILKLENNGTNIPFMKVISSNNNIFEISSNATFNFIQEYDNGYNIVASNIYAPNINIDTIKSSSNIINLYNSTLSNISHMDIGFISSSNVYIDGKLTITGTVNAANLSTNVVSVYKDGDYSELYFDNDKMLTNATGIAINVGTEHYSYSNSRITGVYLNTNRDVSDIRALHILGENSTIRNTVNNQNNRVTILDGDILLQRNAKTYQEFNVNSNIFQIGIKNLSSIADTNASIYITSFNDEVTEDTIDVNNNNCALSISKNNEINIANNFFIDEIGKISVGYNGTSLEDNFNVKGDVRIVNDSNETLFIIENNGNIGFGTEQGQSRLHINTTTSNQDYFVVYDTNTNNTEFIIDKNNRIGIGTVNNTDAKLIIKGDIIPGENGVYTLGNENNTWSNVYISNFIDINGITLENNEIGGIKIKEPIKQQLINYQYYNSNTSEYYQYYTNSNEMMNTYDNMIPKNSLNINNSDIYYNSTTDRVINNLSLVSPPVNNSWHDITWAPELGLLVAVAWSGTGDRVMTSPDGINWTTRTTPVDNNWQSVTWAPELGLFVAVSTSGTGNRVMTSPDGINWTTRVSAADNEWYSITWAPELELFVAVATSGSGDRVMTSPDGINWTTRATPVDNQWIGITWAPELGLFVACSYTIGNNDKIMTSPDGINWTTRNSGPDNDYVGITWSPELKLLVATGGGTNTGVITSPDGINWTARKTENQLWWAVCWCPGINIFAAVSSNNAGQQLMTSPDGIVWTTQNTHSNLNYWCGIVWSPELYRFVAVSQGGSYQILVSGNPNPKPVNSFGLDLQTGGGGLNVMAPVVNQELAWTTRVSAADNGWIGVTWAPELGLLVAVSTSGTGNRVMTSPDGINWTTRSSAADNNWWGLTWAPELGLLVAVARTTTNYTKEPLYNMTANTTVTAVGTYIASASSEIGIGAEAYTAFNGNTALYDGWLTPNNRYNSSTGDYIGSESLGGYSGEWIKIQVPYSIRLIAIKQLSIRHYPSRGPKDFVILGSNDDTNWTLLATYTNQTYSSRTDVKTWYVDSSTEYTYYAMVVSANGGVDGHLEIGEMELITSFNNVMTSPDGITWTSRTSPVDNEWITITWSPELGLFVAVAYSGTGDRVMTSPDGINWTTRSTPVDNTWIGITWSSELELLVATSTSGTGNRVMTSPDGINWTTRSSAADNNWYSITWAPELGLFVAVASSGTGNRVMTSHDGINWTTRRSAADNNWYGITWVPELGLFITVSWSGSGNRVMTSPDGINWTTHSTNDNNWYAITWAPELGLLVATSTSGTGNRVMTAEGTKINKSLLTAKNDIVSIQGSLGIRTEPAINSGLTIRQSVSPNIINSSGHNLNVSPGIQLEGDVQKWGIFITGKDGNNDLVFTQAYKNLNYEGVCAYISRYESSQLMNFTGQHRCHIENIHIDTLKQYEGLIVSANNNKYMNMVNGVVTGNKAITVNESLPIVNITSKNKDKSVFGVISSVEDTNNRNIRYGSFVTPYNKIQGDNRVFINSIGEGSIWISNKNGNIYSGEYITSSDIPGYGQKQDDDILHNYTVAKITMDCDFNPVLQPIQKIKISNSSNNINEPETDEYGNIIFEDTNEYEYSYEVRYLQKDGSIITQEDYNTLLSYGSNVYKAAFVGCTYHCG